MSRVIIVLCFVFVVNIPFSIANDDQIKLLLARPFLKAEFSKVRKLKIMSRPFNTSGKVLFLPGRGLVWETVKPLRDVLFISTHGVGFLDKETNKRVKIANPVVISASDVFMSIISLDLVRIKQIFDINVMASINGVQRYILVPKDESLMKAIQKIEIKGRQRVEEILIMENGGDSTQVMFKNEQFSKDAFSPDEQFLLEML